MTAADHANTVRGVLRRSVWTTGMADNADAALDALQTQAETAEERIQDAKYVGFNRMQARAEAAEAERDRAQAALRLALMHLEDQRAVAAVRAVLATGKEQP